VQSVRSRTDVYKSVDLRNLTVHVQGTIAVVTGEYSQTGTSKGKDISASGIYANTWEKRGGRWLVVHSVFP
jgi:ketosteroid isomerase-like protein